MSRDREICSLHLGEIWYNVICSRRIAWDVKCILGLVAQLGANVML